AVCAQDTLPWEEVRQSLSYSGIGPVSEVLDAGRYRHESPYVRIKQIFDEYGADCFSPDRPILECAQALMQKVYREFSYAPGETDIATPLAEVLQTRRGVCQDFAHLMIACLRTRGLAARYVSGYIRMRPAARAVDPKGEQDGLISESTCAADDVTQDHWVGTGQSHAWVAVYIPPCGWLELDPTNDVRVGTDHIAVAWGRDFGDVSPLRGVILGGGTHALSVGITVEPQSGAEPVAN
ncbi:MAG: transglutaminase-like domain-containing protein, partial [Ktedonobacterales bacterium]